MKVGGIFFTGIPNSILSDRAVLGHMGGASLEALGRPDRGTGAGLDQAGEHLIAGRQLRFMGKSDVAVLQFLRPELFDGDFQLRLEFAKLLRLFGVVLSITSRPRPCRPWRRAVPAGRWRRRARAGDMRDGWSSRTDAALDNQALEGVQVLLLLIFMCRMILAAGKTLRTAKSAFIVASRRWSPR